MFYKIIHIFFIIFFVFFSPVLYAQVDVSEEIPEEVLPIEEADTTSDISVDESQLSFFDVEDSGEISISSVGLADILRIVFVLAIIILIAYGVIWILKKIQNRSLVNAGSIEILSSQSLQQGNMLYVVKSGETYLLLGSTSQSIAIIKEFTKKEEKDELLLTLSINASNDLNTKNDGKGTGFFTLLKNVFSRATKNAQVIDKKNKNKARDANSIAIENELNALKNKAKRGEQLNAH